MEPSTESDDPVSTAPDIEAEPLAVTLSLQEIHALTRHGPVEEMAPSKDADPFTDSPLPTQTDPAAERPLAIRHPEQVVIVSPDLTGPETDRLDPRQATDRTETDDPKRAASVADIPVPVMTSPLQLTMPLIDASLATDVLVPTRPCSPIDTCRATRSELPVDNELPILATPTVDADDPSRTKLLTETLLARTAESPQDAGPVIRPSPATESVLPTTTPKVVETPAATRGACTDKLLSMRTGP